MLGGYDRTRYAVERVFATAPDGVQVPVSIVYRRGLGATGRPRSTSTATALTATRSRRAFSSHA